MARKFKELEAKMSPEAIRSSDAAYDRLKELIQPRSRRKRESTGPISSVCNESHQNRWEPVSPDAKMKQETSKENDDDDITGTRRATSG